MLNNKLTLKQQMLWRILGILIAVVLMTIPIVIFGLAFNECDKVHIFVAYSFLVAVLIWYTAMLCAWHKNDKRVYKWREHLLVKNKVALKAFNTMINGKKINIILGLSFVQKKYL